MSQLLLVARYYETLFPSSSYLRVMLVPCSLVMPLLYEVRVDPGLTRARRYSKPGHLVQTKFNIGVFLKVLPACNGTRERTIPSIGSTCEGAGLPSLTRELDSYT